MRKQANSFFASVQDLSCTGVTSMPDIMALLRSAPQSCARNVEMGPDAWGGGAYGPRCTKAKWNGVFVAVKVVEHNAQTGSMLSTLRESALSQSISHPNVVTTYKIVTIRVDANGEGQAEDLRDPSKTVTPVAGMGGPAKGLDSLPSDSAQTSKGTTPWGAAPRSPPNQISAPRMEVVPTEHGELAILPVKEKSSGADKDSPRNSEDSFSADGGLQETWMILEFCDKGTVEQAMASGRFKTRGTNTPDMLMVLACLKDIASGMEYLHSLGVLHGDLKPANVLLKSVVYDPRRYICKLTDFGLSRVLGDLASHVSTRTYGTISFMPPELIRDAKLSKAADVYSFGVLMWETYCSKTAYGGVPAATVFYMVAVEDQRPAVPDNMPQEYRELMEECWATDMSTRPSFPEVLRRITSMWEDARASRSASRLSVDGKSSGEGAAKASDASPPVSDAAGEGHMSPAAAAAARQTRARQLRTVESMNRGRARGTDGLSGRSLSTPVEGASEGAASPAGPPSGLKRISQSFRMALTRKGTSGVDSPRFLSGGNPLKRASRERSGATMDLAPPGASRLGGTPSGADQQPSMGIVPAGGVGGPGAVPQGALGEVPGGGSAGEGRGVLSPDAKETALEDDAYVLGDAWYDIGEGRSGKPSGGPVRKSSSRKLAGPPPEEGAAAPGAPAGGLGPLETPVETVGTAAAQPALEAARDGWGTSKLLSASSRSLSSASIGAGSTVDVGGGGGTKPGTPQMASPFAALGATTPFSRSSFDEERGDGDGEEPFYGTHTKLETLVEASQSIEEEHLQKVPDAISNIERRLTGEKSEPSPTSPFAAASHDV
eukprot:jgi/Botrbrau1/15122/Bobra.0283s0001.1